MRWEGRRRRKTRRAGTSNYYKRMLGSRWAERKFKYFDQPSQLPRAGMARLARQGPQDGCDAGPVWGTGCQKTFQIPWHSRFPVPPEHPIPLDTSYTYTYVCTPTVHCARCSTNPPLTAISALPACSLATHLCDTTHQVCRCSDGFPLAEFPFVCGSRPMTIQHMPKCPAVTKCSLLLCAIVRFLLSRCLSRIRTEAIHREVFAHRERNLRADMGHLQGPTATQHRGRCRDFSLERGLFFCSFCSKGAMT